MQFDSTTLNMLGTGIWETIYMVAMSSIFSYVIGIPLGVILVVTARDGIKPIPAVEKALGIIINLLRSVPFIILAIMLLPVTRKVVGTTIGPNAMVFPLIVAGSPYIARMVESSFREVDAGVIEAAKSMGASTWQIIYKVLLPESKPSLLVGAAISVTTILGYTAMGGFVGAGGLGAIAINYGYYRYQTDIMLITVAIMVIIVQIIQESFMKLSKVNDKRIR